MADIKRQWLVRSVNNLSKELNRKLSWTGSQNDSPLSVNDNHFRAAGNLVVLKRAPVGVDSNPARKLAFRNKLFDQFGIFICDCNELNRLTSQFFDDLVGVRHGTHAWSSPSSPVVEHDNVSSQRFQIHFICVGDPGIHAPIRFQEPRRGRLLHDQHFRLHLQDYLILLRLQLPLRVRRHYPFPLEDLYCSRRNK